MNGSFSHHFYCTVMTFSIAVYWRTVSEIHIYNLGPVKRERASKWISFASQFTWRYSIILQHSKKSSAKWHRIFLISFWRSLCIPQLSPAGQMYTGQFGVQRPLKSIFLLCNEELQLTLVLRLTSITVTYKVIKLQEKWANSDWIHGFLNISYIFLVLSYFL
jgi:hypothetical protein